MNIKIYKNEKFDEKYIKDPFCVTQLNFGQMHTVHRTKQKRSDPYVSLCFAGDKKICYD